jgi:histidinol-phosphatase (PHP family)
LFDIIGHADLAKKFCFYPKEDCTSLFTTFLTAAKKSGAAVELNTAGLRKDCHEIYPSRRILELAYRAGVPITFGSDAHAPEEVGMNFAEAVQLARSVGYTQCDTFSQRQSKAVELAPAPASG